MIPLSTSKMQRCIAAAALATVLGLSGCSDDSSRNTTPDGTSADDTSAPEGTGGSTAGPAITEPGAKYDYAYFATDTFPYFMGCYHGTPTPNR